MSKALKPSRPWLPRKWQKVFCPSYYSVSFFPLLILSLISGWSFDFSLALQAVFLKMITFFGTHLKMLLEVSTLIAILICLDSVNYIPIGANLKNTKNLPPCCWVSSQVNRQLIFYVSLKLHSYLGSQWTKFGETLLKTLFKTWADWTESCKAKAGGVWMGMVKKVHFGSKSSENQKKYRVVWRSVKKYHDQTVLFINQIFQKVQNLE